MSNTESSADKRVIGTSERREQIIQRLRQQRGDQLFRLANVAIDDNLRRQRYTPPALQIPT